MASNYTPYSWIINENENDLRIKYVIAHFLDSVKQDYFYGTMYLSG